MAIKPVSDFNIDPDAFTLINFLEGLLDKVRGVYERQGVPLPARQYWMMGPEPSEDCEQLVVSFVQSYLGLPGDQAADPQRCNSPRTAVVNIMITRAFPIGENGRAVSPERITEASKWPAIDSTVLLWALNDLNTWEDSLQGPGVIATVNVAPPGGAMQTTVLNLSMAIS